MLYGDISYFAYAGTFYLIWLTYQDFKRKRIDDRKNYLMYGIAFSLLSHIKTSLWFMLALIAIVVALNIIVSKYQLVGSGDISALGWVFMGLGIINIYYLAWFIGIFAVLAVPYTLTLRKILKIKGEHPFMHVVLSSFVICMFLFQIY